MRRKLFPPTRDDVPDESIFERSKINLTLWLAALKAGDQEAIDRLLVLLQGSWGDEETEAGLLEFMRNACDEEALEELFGEAECAFEAHVENLYDGMRYPEFA